MSNKVKMSQNIIITETSALEISFVEIEKALGINLIFIKPRTQVKLKVYDDALNKSKDVIFFRAGKKKLLRLAADSRPNFLLGIIPTHIHISDLYVLKTTEPLKSEKKTSGRFTVLSVGELREALAYLPADYIVMTGAETDPDLIICFPDADDFEDEDCMYIPTRFYQ